jgi:hypothetical protein
MFTLNDQKHELVCQLLGLQLHKFANQWQMEAFRKLPDGVWGTNRNLIISVYDLYLKMGGDPKSHFLTMFLQHWEP